MLVKLYCVGKWFLFVRKMTTSNIRFRTSSTLFYDKCSSSVAGIVLPGISRFSEAAKFNVLGCSLRSGPGAGFKLKFETSIYFFIIVWLFLLCYVFLFCRKPICHLTLRRLTSYNCQWERQLDRFPVHWTLGNVRYFAHYESKTNVSIQSPRVAVGEMVHWKLYTSKISIKRLQVGIYLTCISSW